jgi:hypothetical protein
MSEHASGLCSRFEAFRERSGRWSQGRESRQVMGIVYREHPGSLAKEAWEAYKTSLGKGGWQLLN